MWLKLYGSNMVVIAAINVRIKCEHKCRKITCIGDELLASSLLLQGSSPAGGCLMSLTCDYRIMADNPRYSIGLNETQLGIVAPFW